MRNPKTRRQENNPTGNPPPPVSSRDERTNQDIQEGKAAHNSPKQSQSNPNISNRTIAFLRNKDNQPFITNIIYVSIFLITAVLAWYTYQLFKQANTQSLAAQKSATASEISANAAKKSADLQKQALDSQIVAKKQSDLNDAKKLKRDTDFIKKQEQGIDSQIAALKVTQQEIDFANQSYIQIDGFNNGTVTVFSDYYQIDVSETVSNISNIPAKIITILDTSIVDDRYKDKEIKEIAKKFFKRNTKSVPANIYVIKESPQPLHTMNRFVEPIAASLYTGKNCMYIIKRIFYKNVRTKRNRGYDFIARVFIASADDKSPMFDILYNENYDIK